MNKFKVYKATDLFPETSVTLTAENRIKALYRGHKSLYVENFKKQDLLNHSYINRKLQLNCTGNDKKG
jgi:hypothetical protein